jgi:hypothetical protein
MRDRPVRVADFGASALADAGTFPVVVGALHISRTPFPIVD